MALEVYAPFADRTITLEVYDHLWMQYGYIPHSVFAVQEVLRSLWRRIERAMSHEDFVRLSVEVYLELAEMRGLIVEPDDFIRRVA